MNISELMIKAIAYFLVPGIGTAILYRHCRELFSGRQTLCEELGIDYFTEEISKHSTYFLEHFT